MESNNKRIAKNTMFLYIRMSLNMMITFYTSRVVLDTLGVNDFGIYGVVGGIAAILGFLNSSMAGATSRFLTFEMGRHDFERLKKTFSAALTVHMIIAVIILFLGETVGLWWLENKLVIAPERMNAARWVFHLSILASMINITQVPYNATIIAHERMNVFAYIEIFNTFLKLGIVFLLVFGDFDKLILYSILILCVSVLISIIYRAYCLQHFMESKYKFEWEKDIIKPMVNFSMWNLYGTLAYSAKTQGVNLLLNFFFGVVINAAYGIAAQVQGAIQIFSTNFITAAQPQIVKYYASGEIEKMQNLIVNVSKFSFLLLFLFSFPVILEMDFVLKIWLKNVPDYAVPFCQLNLVAGLLTAMFTVFTYAIFATGKLKLWSIISSTTYILVIPFSYFLLKNGSNPKIPFVLNIGLLFLGYVANVFIFHKYVPAFSIIQFILKVFLICLLIVFLTSIIPLYMHYTLDSGWQRFVIVTVSSIFTAAFLTYFIALNSNLKKKVVLSIKRKL